MKERAGEDRKAQLVAGWKKLRSHCKQKEHGQNTHLAIVNLESSGSGFTRKEDVAGKVELDSQGKQVKEDKREGESAIRRDPEGKSASGRRRKPEAKQPWPDYTMNVSIGSFPTTGGEDKKGQFDQKNSQLSFKRKGGGDWTEWTRIGALFKEKVSQNTFADKGGNLGVWAHSEKNLSAEKKGGGTHLALSRLGVCCCGAAEISRYGDHRNLAP